MQYDENFEKHGYDGEMTPLKCDELTPIELECNMGKDINGVVQREPWKAYDIDEVNAAIAELKEAWRSEHAACEALKAKLEDAGMRERRLRRALWLARAERAKEAHFMWCQLIYDKKYGIVKFNVRKEWGENVKQGQALHTPQGWADVWDEVEYKCLKKAEVYK